MSDDDDRIARKGQYVVFPADILMHDTYEGALEDAKRMAKPSSFAPRPWCVAKIEAVVIPEIVWKVEE